MRASRSKRQSGNADVHCSGHIFVFKHKAVAGEMADMTTGTAPAARAEAAREVLALRNLVAVYRRPSGLAVQDADLAAVTRLIAEQTGATVAMVAGVGATLHTREMMEGK